MHFFFVFRLPFEVFPWAKIKASTIWFQVLDRSQTEFTKMYDLLKEEFILSTADSVTPSITGSSPCWTSAKSHIYYSYAEESCLSKSLSLKIATQSRHCQSSKQLQFHFQDQDLSPTQSSSRSYPEVAVSGESNLYGHDMTS